MHIRSSKYVVVVRNTCISIKKVSAPIEPIIEPKYTKIHGNMKPLQTLEMFLDVYGGQLTYIIDY